MVHCTKHPIFSKPCKTCKARIKPFKKPEYRPQEHSPRGWKLCFEKVKLLRGHTGEVLRKIVRLKNEIARLEQTSSTKDERIKQLEQTIATKDERIQQL